jgi:2-C-methyl-D-erythritol 4-phosphate cytidylyltransferase
MRTVAVVLAGGSGSRFGGSMPKQLRQLAGRSLVEHCVAAFDQAPAVDEVLVVTPADRTAATAADLHGYRKLTAVVAGGATRSDSTRQAIAAITAAAAAPGAAAPDCNVLFHDAARPLVDQRIIADCVTALASWQAIGVVVPSSDTIVETDGSVLGRVLPRATLARCQTPQGFRLSVITRAYELAAADPEFSATDDCGVVRRYLPGIPIGAVPGSERNLKVTYPGDLAVAQALLADPAPEPPA